MIEPTDVGKVTSFDSTRIAYQCFGDAAGPALLLGNGIGVGYGGLERQIAALARHMHVVSWDHRGVFGSDPPGEGGVGMGAHGSDALALIDQLGLARPCYLGWSMGVQVGLEAWRQRPGVFSRVAFVSGVASNPFHAAMPLPGLDRTVPAALRAVAPWAARVAPLLSSVIASEGFVVGARLLGLLHRGADDRLFRTMTRGVASHDIDLYLRTLAELAAHRAEDVLPTLDVPVLFLAGESDKMTPAGELRRLSRLTPRGRVHVVQQSTHFVPIEQPDEVNRVLLELFAPGTGETPRREGPG